MNSWIKAIFASILFCGLVSCSLFGLQQDPTPSTPAGNDDFFTLGTDKRTPVRPKPLPVHRPVQRTFEADSVQGGALSGDGEWLAAITEQNGISKVTLHPTDSSRKAAPRIVTPLRGRIRQPALSGNGRWLAFTGTPYDVKGDIYLLDLQNGAKNTPVRLTGRATEDGAPEFSPDSTVLYFHQSTPGEPAHRLMALHLQQNLPVADASGARSSEPTVLKTDRDAMFPSISPDGQRCAFVSFQEDPGGNIFVLELNSGTVEQVTQGPYQDRDPCWSTDGNFLYFSRSSPGSEADEASNGTGPPTLHRIGVDNAHTLTCPLTAPSHDAFGPMVSGNRLYFLSSPQGITNIWSLPLGGQIPSRDTGKAQLQLAQTLATRISPKDGLTLLAFHKALETSPLKGPLQAKAAFSLGRWYESLNRSKEAVTAYKLTTASDASSTPETVLAEIHLQALLTRQAFQKTITDPQKAQVLEDGLMKLKRFSEDHPHIPIGISGAQALRIQARALIEQARLMALERQPQSILKAMECLDRVLESTLGTRTQRAEALFLKAGLYDRMGKPDSALKAYIHCIKRYPEAEKWADRSVDRILGIQVSSVSGEAQQQKIQMLRQIIRDYAQTLPKLAMAGLNRIGDVYYAKNQWQQAKSAYRQVLTQFKVPDTQTAGARLALAEILYREERFRQALDLYETEMGARTYEDTLYRLIREGYVQKSLAAADFHYTLGEVPLAQHMYINLIREEYDLVRAHRGYIQCAAAQKKVARALARYRNRLAQAPDDPITLYAVGLCLTYLEGLESLQAARNRIQGAIGRDGQVAYFHQTLGYIHEVSETAYDQSGGLERALRSYQKAYFLNNPQKDPKNEADLALNLGNIYFLLENFPKASDYYTQRLESAFPFDHPQTEMLFYQRLGATAFQLMDADKSLSAYGKAVELIQKAMDPQQASALLGRFNTYISDRILTPALNHASLSDAARDLAEKQAAIHQDLFDITSAHAIKTLPDPAWETYKKAIESIMDREQGLLVELTPFLRESVGQAEASDHVETLRYMLIRTGNALDLAPSLARRQAELSDRLALAFQAKGNWEKARKNFARAYRLNEAMGHVENLAVNRRSQAYAGYMEAGEHIGRKRIQLLQTALEGFQDVIHLVDRYGVAGGKKGPKAEHTRQARHSLLEVSFDVALDKTTASQAMYGFSPEQEKRLARTYISRIQVELNRLKPAQTHMKTILSPYKGQPLIPEADQYGVSLLYHRAGLLDYALKEPDQAFEHFRESAQLCLRMENPVSAALNMRNMAFTLHDLSPQQVSDARLSTLLALDRRASRLLDQRSHVLKSDIIPVYHNTMGALFLKCLSEPESQPIHWASQQMVLLAASGDHFSKALQYLTENRVTPPRKALELSAALHLNMAQAAIHLKDSAAASDHLDQALDAAREGLLPEYEWRVLAYQGHFQKALKVLESVSILTADCAPREITRAFVPLVLKWMDNGEVEQAFNLMERISEIERIHRMSPLLWGHLSEAEQALLIRIYPRLVQIQNLTHRLNTAKESEKNHLKQRLKEEKALLGNDLGENREDIPTSVQIASSEILQDHIMILLGAALLRRQAAEKTVASLDSPQAARQKEQYQEYRAGYDSAMAALQEACTRANQEALAALFIPNPAQAIDIMANLAENETFIRLVAYDAETASWRALMLSSQDISSAQWKADKAQALSNDPQTLAWEQPDKIKGLPPMPVALSATHLFRCMGNKKPFKRHVLAVGYAKEIPAPFVTQSLPLSVKPDKIFQALEGTHTLILDTPVRQTRSVPTRPGEIPVPYMGIRLDQGRRLSMVRLKHHLINVSLVILPQSSIKDAYLLGHMFSLWGVPTLLLPREPSKSDAFIIPFLDAYGNQSVLEALITVEFVEAKSSKVAESHKRPKEQWFQMGYQGMTPQEAMALAKKRFARYVRNGVKAFQENNSQKALTDFENALTVTRAAPKLKRYQSKLHTYARESAFTAGRIEKAHHHAKTLVQILFRQHPDSEEHAVALLKLGLIEARLEHYDQAISHLEQGVDIMSHLELGPPRISALADLGVVLENAADYQEALEYFESAASLSRSMNKPQLMAQQYMRMGRIYDLRLSRYAQAKQNYERAFEIHTELGQKEAMAQSLLDLGRCDRLLGNFETAARQYEQALSLLGPDPSKLKANIWMEQANNAWFQARYQNAFALQGKVHKLAVQNHWPLEQVMALNTSGLIWWTLGDPERALRELQQALALAETLRIRTDEKATTLNNLSLLYREMGDYQKALDALDQALSIDTALNSRWAMAYDLKNQAMTHLWMNKPEKAVPLFTTALDMARGIGNQINVAKILVGYAESLERMEQLQESENRYKEALSLSQDMYLRETQWRALYGLGRLSLTRGDRPKARGFLSRSIEVIEETRAEIKLEQLKDGFIHGKMSVYETLVSVLVEMGNPGEAFNVAERSRARNLIDLLGNQRLTLKGAIEQERYDEQKRLTSRIREYEALVAQAKTEAERRTYEKGLTRTTDAYTDLMLRIQAENPELASLISVNPLDVKKIQSLIEPEVALLNFYVVPDQVLCWVVTPDSVTLHQTPLGRTTLRETVLQYRRRLQNLEPVRDISKTLYAWLLSRVFSQLRTAKTLGVIPHDALHHLSMATLYDGREYVADRFPLFYLPGASVLEYTLQRRKPDKNPRVLAIGNPDLKSSALELPFAEHEVASIGWNFPNITVLTGEKATENWVVRHIQDFGIVHMASHGEFDPINPLFSAIKLAKDPQDDGELNAAEIFGLRIQADLVVLSACQTGLGKVTRGDDVIGLNRAFLYAGTHALISSLWRVSDISTAMLVKQFYRDYATENKADSLKQAISHVKNRFPHPGYWGAFVLVGDYR